MMRLAESDGTFDVYHHGKVPIAFLKVGYIQGDADLKEYWGRRARNDGRLDDSGRLSHTVDAFGRVSLLIASADAA
jgi:hypothetical protein